MSQGYAIELYFDPALENQVLKALNVLARCQIDGRLDLAIEFLDYMISDDCLPDIVNYNTILAALCKSGKADQALQIFKNFDEVGCPSNVSSYNTMSSTVETEFELCKWYQKCPNHFYTAFWMGLFGTIQSAIVTLILEHDLQVWNIHSTLEIVSGLFAGFATGLTFSVQTWCVSIRGPLFVAMFTPLCTVITTIVAAVFLHEELYLGSLVGGVAVVIGLYIVLWGKAKDQQKTKQETDPNQSRTVDQILIDDDSTEKTSCKIDLEEPLLKKEKSPFI
ncbi:hypothetical protein ACFX2I_013317 [Malus domestica]